MLMGVTVPEHVRARNHDRHIGSLSRRISGCEPSTLAPAGRNRRRGALAVTETITVLFTDLVGSTEISYAISPDAADELLRAHFSVLRRAIAELRRRRGQGSRRRGHGRVPQHLCSLVVRGGDAASRPP